MKCFCYHTVAEWERRGCRANSTHLIMLNGRSAEGPPIKCPVGFLPQFLRRAQSSIISTGGCFSFPLCSHKKSQNSKSLHYKKKLNYLHTGIYLSDGFSVKRGSLGSGKNCESSCPFPWKHCGQRKEKECGKNIHFLGETQHKVDD